MSNKEDFYRKRQIPWGYVHDYKPPNGMTHLDVALWCYNNTFDMTKCDLEKLWEYIRIMVCMYTSMHNDILYFYSADECNEFMEYCTMKIYNKYFKEHITNVGSYIEHSIRGAYIDFHIRSKSNRFECAGKPVEDIIRDIGDSHVMFSHIAKNPYTNPKLNLDFYVDYLDSVIDDVLSVIPYKSDYQTYHAIHTSCLLTLLNQFTISDKLDVVFGRVTTTAHKQTLLLNGFSKLNDIKFVVLYHLNENMRSYVFIQCKRIRKQIAEDIKWVMRKGESEDNFVGKPKKEYSE